MDLSDFYLSYYYKPQKGILGPFDSAERAIVMERSEDSNNVTIRSRGKGQRDATVKTILWSDVPAELLGHITKLEETKESFMSQSGEQWHSYLDGDTSLTIASADVQFRHFVDGDGMGTGPEEDVAHASAQSEEEDDLGVPVKKPSTQVSAAHSELKSHFDRVIQSLHQWTA